MQSIEKTTGLQKEINIEMSSKDNKLELIYRIHNRTNWPIEFSVWPIAMMKRNGKVIIPFKKYKNWNSDGSIPLRSLVLWPYTNLNDKRFIWGKKYLIIKQKNNSNGPTKIGLFNDTGWEAYCLNDNLVIKKHSIKDSLKYPDLNCNTEIYIDGDYLELESLSPLEIVSPNNYLEHKEHFYLYKVSIGDSEDFIDKNILPITRRTDIL